MPITQVTISDSFTLAVGGEPMVGSFVISWNAFTDSNGTWHPTGQKTVTVPSHGQFSFHLAPNLYAIPANSFYEVQYFLRNGGQSEGTDYLLIPATLATLSMEQVRVNRSVPVLPFQVQISQLYSPTANVGDVVMFNGTSWVATTVQPVYPFLFSGQSQVSIPAGTHGQGGQLIVQVFDTAGYLIDPGLNVDTATSNVTLAFNAPTSGHGFIYGGLGRTLPSFSQFFAGVQTVVIPQSAHRLNTPNLAIAVYDASGYAVNIAGKVQISSTFDVTVAFNQPSSFSVVIVSCLGVSPIGVLPGASGTAGSALVGSGSLTVGMIPDGDVAAIGTIAVTGAILGQPVLVAATTVLTQGLVVSGQVTAPNTVSVSITNLSGGDQTPGSVAFNANVVTQVITGGQSGGTLFAPSAGMVRSDGTSLLTATTGVDYQAPLSFPLTLQQGGTGTITPGLSSGAGIQVSGTWPNQTISNTASGTGSSPYIQTVTAVLSVTIAASTHGKGTYAIPHGFTNDTPSVSAVLSYTRDSSGNLVIQFSPAFTGLIQIN